MCSYIKNGYGRFQLIPPKHNLSFNLLALFMREETFASGISTSHSLTPSGSPCHSHVNTSHCSALTDSATSAFSTLALTLYTHTRTHFPPHHTKCTLLGTSPTVLSPLKHHWPTSGNTCICAPSLHRQNTALGS